MSSTVYSCATIGFPRIGSKRQQKSCLESFWKGGSLSEPELRRTSQEVDAEAWSAQRDAGVQRVALDGTWYDHILDTVWSLGLIPSRFKGLQLSGAALYFAMARGVEGCAALDMSKYFDTNYHYLVPELEPDFNPNPDFSQLLERVQAGQKLLGKEAAIPMIVGPLTLVLLSRRSPGLSVSQALDRLLPAYCQLLNHLHDLGCPEAQLHEPSLATDAGEHAAELLRSAYARLAQQGCPIDLVVPYGDLSQPVLELVLSLPLKGLSLDFLGVPGAAYPNQTAERVRGLLRAGAWPPGLRLGAGVVDGRSVWKDDAGAIHAWVSELSSLGLRHVSIQPSVSLQHLPWSVGFEPELPAAAPAARPGSDGVAGMSRGLTADLRRRLAFACEKLQTLVSVAKAARAGAGAGAGAGAAVLAPGVPASDAGLNTPPADSFRRAEPFAVRRPKQMQFPAFPTTSIGSFPQTAEVRRVRALLNKGQLSPEQYQARMDAFITHAIGVQEALDLDVLVHGEAERTDMVEFFGEKLEGLAFTAHAWVQSYGSRYVRPPIIAADVAWRGPMTLREWRVAAAAADACSGRPVKAMLTGPVTILNWSFPRKDISRAAQALQLATALRSEVDALQCAGCKIIQVDEPALREGLPLKKERWQSYLSWAVDAFRLATAVARPDVQIVTHLCYSDFQDILQAVDDMDADVLTIENSRSGDEMVRALSEAGYSKDLGPGVYDVHSPVVPPVQWFVDKITAFVDTSKQFKDCPERLWINPDCGLKTRNWAQVIPALRNMVQAAHVMRQQYYKDCGAPDAGPCRAHEPPASRCC